MNALAPLIGAEAELGRAVSLGWADESKIDEWRERSAGSLREETERVAQEACAQEYGRLMHKVRLSTFHPFSAPGLSVTGNSAWVSAATTRQTRQSYAGRS